jgi:MoxR-like ATPase
MSETNPQGWWIYKGTGLPHEGIKNLPHPPNWREFTGEVIAGPRGRATIKDADIRRHIGSNPSRSVRYEAIEDKELIKEIEMVNAALYLRRPLLVTGKPGSGKSSLAYAVAYELQLGPVLRWPITTRSTLADGLYRYDAIGRLQDASYKRSLSPDAPLKDSANNIGKYLRLGALGTALLPVEYPRVLLIDEIDKSDIDLPNDLLNIFEEGYFDIPELKRIVEEEQKEKKGEPVMVMPDDGEDDSDRVPIFNGRVQCNAFPFVILTSNGERDFPPAFKRRCLQLEMHLPNQKRLAEIVEAHFGQDELKQDQTIELIKDFLALREKGKGALATDQLLNAIYMTSNGVTLQDKENLSQALLRYLAEAI